MMSDRPKVVKLAQPGYDVHSAGDENLIYNSNWPLLKIYKQGSFSLFDRTSGKHKIVDHDLGYVPAFVWFNNTTLDEFIISGGNPKQGFPDRRAEYFGLTGNGFQPRITDTQLTFDVNIGFYEDVQIYYYIFALDVTKLYIAPKINIGSGVAGKAGSTVFKLAKPGKDISSTNLEDFVIHSHARSPLIHAVYPGVTEADANSPGGFGFTFYHNLGYTPMVLAYDFEINYNGTPEGTFNTWGLFQLGTRLDPSLLNTIQDFIIDDKKVWFRAIAAGIKVTLVILKDPFTVDYSVTVTV